MRILKLTFVITLLLIASNNILAQDAKTAFEKVNEKFTAHNKISYNITYSYYVKKGDKTPSATTTGQFKKLNKNYYSKIGPQEIIVNENYKILIDNDTKHLVVEDRVDNLAETPLTVNMDSALKVCSKITSKKSNTLETFTLYFDSTRYNYNQIDVVYDNTIGFIKKIVIHLLVFDEEESIVSTPVLEISISGFTVTPLLSESFFSENNYVAIDANGQVSLKKKYLSYKLLNNQVFKKQ